MALRVRAAHSETQKAVGVLDGPRGDGSRARRRRAPAAHACPQPRGSAATGFPQCCSPQGRVIYLGQAARALYPRSWHWAPSNPHSRRGEEGVPTLPKDPGTVATAQPHISLRQGGGVPELAVSLDSGRPPSTGRRRARQHRSRGQPARMSNSMRSGLNSNKDNM